MFGLPLRARSPAPRKLSSGECVQVGGHPVRLKVDGRAKRVSLRLDGAAREVIAIAPSLRRLPEALAFAHARIAWIDARLGALPHGVPFAPGVIIPVYGAPCRLERAAMRTTGRLVPATPDEPQRLVASGDGPAFSRAVERVLKRDALARLTALTQEMCDALALPLPALALGDAKGRWGSCRSPLRGDAGVIRYSWRLICAPPNVQRYVAAHECAHLVHPNHAAGFWALNRRLDPAMDPARAWLKQNGADLHALGRG
ncbi:M48 family metallopeptidase [soil metagenome]